MRGDSVEHLSQEVRALCTKLGWTQEELARQIDVSLSTVQRLERNRSRPSRLAQRELNKLF